MKKPVLTGEDVQEWLASIIFDKKPTKELIREYVRDVTELAVYKKDKSLLPTIESMGKLDLSETAIRRALKSLIEEGCVKVSKDFPGRPNRYAYYE